MESRNPILMMARALISRDRRRRRVFRAAGRFGSRATPVRVGRQLRAVRSRSRNIELGALLHDLGRDAILNDVLLRPRPLDAGERTGADAPDDRLGADQGHPAQLEAAAEIVHCHHERPDGKGYPRGLKNDTIPNGSRIIMVCAAFDAMTEDRPYRRGLPSRAACEELHRNAGTSSSAMSSAPSSSSTTAAGCGEDFTREEMDLYVRRGGVAAA